MGLYWRFFQTAVIFPLIVFALGSCTFLGSHNLQHLGADEKLDANGVYYALPKGVVEFQLHYVPAEDRYVLRHLPVQYIPDPELEFNLQYQPLPNYEDEITVQVGRNSIIKKIHSTTDDKTPDVVVNVAKAFKALSGFESQQAPANSLLIIQKIIDPTQDQEVRTLMREFNDAIAENTRQLELGCDTFRDRIKAPEGIYKSTKTKKEGFKRKKLNELTKLMQEKDLLEAQNKLIIQTISPDPITAFENAPEETNFCPARAKPGDKSNGKNKKPKTDENKKDGGPFSRMRETDEKILKICTLTSQDTNGNSKKSKICDDYKRQKHRCNIQRLAQLEREIISAKNAFDTAADAVATFQNVASETQKSCEHIRKLPSFNVLIKLIDFKNSVASIQPVLLDQAVPTPNCTQGVCYRPKEPYRLVYGVSQQNSDGETLLNRFDTSIIELPNRAAPVLIDLRRAFFVKKIHNIDFDADGFLKIVKIDKPSELEAVSSLPVEVLKAVSEGLTLRINLLNKQRDVAKKEAELIKSKADFRQFQAQFESARK